MDHATPSIQGVDRHAAGAQVIGAVRPEQFRNVEALFLDAALDPDLWPVALGAFARAGGSEASLFMTAQSATGLGAPSAGFEEIIEAATADGWPQRNPRFPRINARTWTNFVCDTELLTADEIARDPFYNELLRPFGLKWAAGSVLLSSPTLGPVVLTLERALEAEPFTPAELAAIDLLRPSFARAVRLAESLGFRKLDGMIEGWEAADIAGAILGPQGAVLRTTGALTALLGDGLMILGNRLTAMATDDNRRLQAGLDGSARPPGAAAGPILVRRPSGRPPLVVDISPLARDRLLVFNGARAIAVVRDPARLSASSERRLATLFGLSRAEARLAALLGSGVTLAEAAERLTIRYETARTQLKSVFVKTDTHRQADLVALFARLG
ncbi:helix-turn-helix transcriptional regulator [Inquilinus sp. NPDC058860]|uniref:helix-turn-helix transcriptional regulator n=1 Tax=Inquilinus sp. NPDC058860 TaxID=3346652 RepID=UPI003681B26A